MSPSREIFLDVLYVYQNSSDTISIQTRDRQVWNLGGNAPKHLRLVAPFRKMKDGSLAIPEEYIQLCNTITFYFTDGPFRGRQSNCSFADRHGVLPEDDNAGSGTLCYEAAKYFAATHGGEVGQRLQIPSPSSLDFYEYEVERRQVSIQQRDSAEFSAFDVLIDVYCRAVEPE
jgi:hypothetical protein